MNTRVEVIEIKLENRFIDELIVIAKTKDEASYAAEKWCDEHNCELKYLFSEHEFSGNTQDPRMAFYAKIDTRG
ncbi:MAG: hypothetical protein M3Z92_10935 [Bacteroidota bacterium]|nr:hypothetical protein [Bacteroidota bacterium]